MKDAPRPTRNSTRAGRKPRRPAAGPVQAVIDRFKAVSLERHIAVESQEAIEAGFPAEVREALDYSKVPEPYRGIYKKHQADEWLLADEEFDAGDELAGAIHQAAGATAWGFATFLDERDGRTWVAFPPGVSKEFHPAMGYPHLRLTMRDGEQSWTSIANNLLAFDRGERLVIATSQLVFDVPEAVIEIGPAVPEV